MSSRILSIETSTTLLGVAVICDERIVFETSFLRPRIHSAMLLPFCLDALDKSGIAGQDISCIAVSLGPGSFTGLRIGAATAQGLAYSWDKPVVMVPSFSVYLYQAKNVPHVAIASGTAKAQAVSAFFEKREVCQKSSGVPRGVHGDFWERYGFRELIPMGPRDPASFRDDLLKSRIEPIYVTGDGAPQLVGNEGGPFVLMDLFWRLPRPGVLGIIGAEMFRGGLAVEPERALPEYVRESQAEVKRQEQDRQLPGKWR